MHVIRSWARWFSHQSRATRQTVGASIFFAVLCLAYAVSGDLWSAAWFFGCVCAAVAWTWWSSRRSPAAQG